MLTIERKQMLLNGDVEFKEWLYLKELDNNYYNFCTNGCYTDDFDALLFDYNYLLFQYYDSDNITGFVFKIKDGDIIELWFTVSSKPYDITAIYYKIF